MKKGVYALIIEVPRDEAIRVGSLGTLLFKKGFYLYVGSALSGLESRINRHLSSSKRLRWHIDYLTALYKPKLIIYAETSERIECLISTKLRESLSGVDGFGSSDCKCRTHLYYFKDLSFLLSSALRVFEELGLTPILESVSGGPAGI